MAITGKFAADFASFYDAVQKAEVSLNSMEAGGAKVEAQINKVANSLEGGKIVQQATIAAAAVEQIGGISKLTEAELARVGATATEAAAKLKAMGQDVPAGIQAIADASHAAAKGSDEMGQSWVARVAEGMLLRDAIREALNVMKEMIAALPELAMKGAAVEDIETSFERLTEQAGLSSDVLLGTLRTATHGTIDDFTLMQRTNKDLAAGLNLTDAQFGTLAEGAYALAKATGGSTTEALNTMSDAMVTGRAKAVAMLTGKIDLKAAEESYAASLGGTADQLTAEQKIEADRIAILEGVQRGIARVGEQTDNLDDKVEQGRVTWENFQNQLGKQIAQSPVVISGIDGIKAAFGAAFGGNQENQIKTIVGVVNELAVDVVDAGIAAGGFAGVMVQAWGAIESIVLAGTTAVTGFFDVWVEGVTVAAEAAGKMHLISPETVATLIDFRTQTRGMVVDLASQTAEAGSAALGHSKLNEAIERGVGQLMVTRDTMLSTATETEKATEKTTEFVAPVEKVTQSLGASKAELKAYADAMTNLAAVGTTWQQTLAGINPGLVEDAKQMLLAGANAKDLEVAWGLLPPVLKAIEMSIKDDAEATKTMAAQEAELTKASAEHYKAVNAASHNTVQAQIDDAYVAAAARIAAMEKTKSYSVEAEMEIWAAAKQTADNIVQKALESDVHTHAHFIKLADDAKNAYDFAMEHADQFSTAWLQHLREAADAARVTADTWTASMGDALDGIGQKAAATTDAIVGGFHRIVMASAEAKIAMAPESDYQAQIDQGYSGLTGYRTANEIASGRIPDAITIAARAAHGIQARETGGPVSAGQTYLVGERGPELFVPSTSGGIVPNGAGGSIHIGAINVTQPLGTPSAIAAAVDQALSARLRNTGVRF